MRSPSGEGESVAQQAIVRRVSPVNGQPVPPPAWKPGQSGNPRGRPNAGASVVEWVNALQNCTQEELVEMRDSRIPQNKRVAVNAWLMAGSSEKNATGNYVAVQPIKDLLDRALGKPMQQMEVTHLDPQTLDLTKLSIEQIAKFCELLELATGKSVRDSLPDQAGEERGQS